MKRLGALLAAVAMVLGAVLIRDAMDDGSLDVVSGDGDDSGGQVLRVRCSTELGSVCTQATMQARGIEVTIGDAGETADELTALPSGENPGFDVWFVDASWSGIVADNRSQEGRSGSVLGEPSAVLARSPALIAVQSDRRPLLEPACGGTITWTCLGERAGDGLSVGMPRPDRGDGLTVLASAVANRLGRSDFATNDFESPEFTAWFADLIDLSTRTKLGDQTALERAVIAQGTFAVVGALESDMVRYLRSGDRYAPIYPDAVVTYDAVLVPTAGTDLDAALERFADEELTDVLQVNGWRVPGRDAPEVPGAPPALDDDPGTPRPGVLQTLREQFAP